MRKSKLRNIVFLIFNCLLLIGNIVGIVIISNKYNQFNYSISNASFDVQLANFYNILRKNYQNAVNQCQFYVDLVLHDSCQYNPFFNYNIKDLKNIDLQHTMEWVNFTFSNHPIWSKIWTKNTHYNDLHENITLNLKFIEDETWVENLDEYKTLIRSPLETALYCMGDCEEFSTFTSALFEYSGFDTVLGIVDYTKVVEGIEPYSNTSHMFLWIKLPKEFSVYLGPLWRFGNGTYEWFCVEPQSINPLSYNPSFVQHYQKHNLSDWSKIFQWMVVAPPNDPQLSLNYLIPEPEDYDW